MDPAGSRVDFDQWLALASRDLQAFEAMRRSKINQFIAQAPKAQQDRLRRLQWRIDQERRLSKSPMGACIRISRMMWEQMMGEGGLVDQLHALNAGNFPGAQGGSGRGAKVIPLVPGQYR